MESSCERPPSKVNGLACIIYQHLHSQHQTLTSPHVTLPT